MDYLSLLQVIVDDQKSFIMEYDVIYVISGVIFVLCVILEVYEAHIPDTRKIYQQFDFIVKTFQGSTCSV